MVPRATRGDHHQQGVRYHVNGRCQGQSLGLHRPQLDQRHPRPDRLLCQDHEDRPRTVFLQGHLSGSHEASILAVKGGKVDIASTNDLDLARGNGKAWQTDKDFQILWTSELIPGSPMACRKDLPDSLKSALKEAFLSYDDKEGLKMLKLQGYAATDDATYNPIREQIEVKNRWPPNSPNCLFPAAGVCLVPAAPLFPV